MVMSQTLPVVSAPPGASRPLLTGNIGRTVHATTKLRRPARRRLADVTASAAAARAPVEEAQLVGMPQRSLLQCPSSRKA